MLSGKKLIGVESPLSEKKASEGNKIRKGSWKLVEVDRED